MKKIKLVLLAIFGLCISMANAQIFKDTIWVPVTFYDFHSDGSNPEFEPPFFNEIVYHGMVANNLDADGKPQVGTSINQNAYIKYWFRQWKQGDYTIPVYTQTGGTAWAAQITYDGPKTVNYDTAFKNIVIHDSLPFRHIGGGLYQYENQAFFPLDGRGFGNEGRSHNYSFAMELKWPFQKKVGQTFDFTGDDDVWAFVNNNLVMDLGGIHPAATGIFSLDTNIHENSLCTLSVFYCERHTDASDIKITTNIVSPKLTLHIEPNSSICLGDTVVAKVQISSGTQVLTKLPSGCTLTWGLIDPNNPASTMTKIDSVTCRFVPVKASTAKLWCDLYDPVNNFHLRDTASVVTNLCLPEPSTMDLYDASGDPKTMSALPDTITVVAGTHKNVYVMLYYIF